LPGEKGLSSALRRRDNEKRKKRDGFDFSQRNAISSIRRGKYCIPKKGKKEGRPEKEKSSSPK